MQAYPLMKSIKRPPLQIGLLALFAFTMTITMSVAALVVPPHTIPQFDGWTTFSLNGTWHMIQRID